MALVAYSDSEGSDTEPVTTAPLIKPTSSSTNPKPTFQKVVDSSRPGSRKIKVELPSFKPETQQGDEPGERPAKRSRTGGAFSGFNSLLPAPKRRAQNAGPKAGVNLKTSSEAAFPRASIESQLPKERNEYEADGQDATAGTSTTGNVNTSSGGQTLGDEDNDGVAKEPKGVGKATRFMPLSVAGKKKKPKPKLPAMEETPPAQRSIQDHSVKEAATGATPEKVSKAKRSLFSVTQEEADEALKTSNGPYQPIFQRDRSLDGVASEAQSAQNTPIQANPNSLETVASDLNLTAAQRRQLFGRNGAGSSANIQTFNTEAEYAANEHLRQAGEVVEHRAVKAIAPGKHSLQQLVSNAKTQQDAMEDKWAAGRRERGEAGGKYGWGK
ncbi:hypothetical protein K431DRAFT_288645 [Polychaeton citri CBS 116435]|uniref:Mitotic checkpoint regulator, MAD2B-interacting-domain-containing protein n=1 Tax=Polychaeton citri CBS 116435 TaxID=1314669 RepID=A0A9P4ULI2_9PEZI|nr:hypothetical protein K431DRAFT_288645 [Polychaeton citri CBS 116435]